MCSGGDGAAAAGGAGGGRLPPDRPGAGEEGPRAGVEDRSERVGAHPRGGADRRRPAQVTLTGGGQRFSPGGVGAEPLTFDTLQGSNPASNESESHSYCLLLCLEQRTTPFHHSQKL